MKYILSFFIGTIFIARINADCYNPNISYVSTEPPVVTTNSISVIFHIYYNETDNGTGAIISFDFGDGIIEDYDYINGTYLEIQHDYTKSSQYIINGVYSVTAHAELMGEWCNVKQDILINVNIASTGYILEITPIPDYRWQGYPADQATIQFSYNIISDKTPASGELVLSIINNTRNTVVYSDFVDPGNINKTISLTDDKFKFTVSSGSNIFQAILYSYDAQVATSNTVDIGVGTGSTTTDCDNPPDPVVYVDPIMIDMNTLSDSYQLLDISDESPSGLTNCAQIINSTTGYPGQRYFDIKDAKKNMGYSTYTYPVNYSDLYYYGSHLYLNDYTVYKKNYDVETGNSYIDVILTYSYYITSSVVKEAKKRIIIYPQKCDDNNYPVVDNSVTINSHTNQCIGIVFYNPTNQNDDFSYINNIQIDNTNRTITLTLNENYELNDRNFEAHIFVNSGYDKCYSAENGNYRNVKITQPTLTSDLIYSSSDKTGIANYTPPANAAYFKISGTAGSKYLTNCNNVPINLISDVSNGSGNITIEAYDNNSLLLNTKTCTIKICKCEAGCFKISDIPNYNIYIAYNTDATTIENTQINSNSVDIFSQSIVKLRPGLSVKNGAFFSAAISSCNSLKSSPLVNDSPGINPIIAANIDSETRINNLRVFPNPSRGIFNIVTDEFITETKNYIIEDLSGKILLKGKIYNTQTTIDMSGCKAGFYILRILSSNNYIFKKLIIN